MKKIISVLATLLAAVFPHMAYGDDAATRRVYLSGIDKDSGIMWDFKCTSGRKSGKWTRIKVPSCWETQGFGSYYYGWEEPYGSDETGLYRHKFHIPRSFHDKRIDIVFEGVMTDTEVKVNGKQAGPVHEGGFYRFRYDITDKLKYGADNLLEVKVRKCPADSSVYRAERQTDFWLFGGIYRPVYLEVKPSRHIRSISVDARSDGSLAVYPDVSSTKKERIEIRVETSDRSKVVATASGYAGDTIRTKANGIIPWNQENPVLYRVTAEIVDKGKVLHRVEEKAGFRTIEFRPADGFYLNGKRVIFKGVNRHCFWPESGRTLSREISLRDAGLIKDMNMNAVRMSHYPPDKDFLEICDSIGLLVIDELCGWQKKYDAGIARRLAKEVVERDRNHPCVILWANGNEGGWNTEVDNDYRLHDLQQRFVIHPWERFRGTDTKHYPDYNYVVNSSIYDNDIFFPTEFMHGVFDGGAGASLRDFWDVMMRHRAPAGGFIWALLDEGLVRSDMNDSIDCKQDLAPDGIVGPYREKEGSFYAIRDIWSPVRITDRSVDGTSGLTLGIENDYMFTNLADCAFSYSLFNICNDGEGGFRQTKAAEGNLESPSILPGERRVVTFNLPENWQDCDLLSINVSDPHGRQIHTYAYIPGNDRLQKRLMNAYHPSEPIEVKEDENSITVAQGADRFIFSKKEGNLDGIETQEGHISLHGFPNVATSGNVFTGISWRREGEHYIVEPRFERGQWIRWVFSPSEPPRVDYSFSVDGEKDFIGIGFNYPEEKILGMEWVGRGPYRVWKNRLDGVAFGVHSKKYNNAVTGESHEYPEFKGYHADCRAVTVRTTEGNITFVPSKSGIFLQMLTPQAPAFAGKGYTVPPFPESEIGFMHAIPPIGTKFQKPEQLGPSGQKNMQLNYHPFAGSLHIIL